MEGDIERGSDRVGRDCLAFWRLRRGVRRLDTKEAGRRVVIGGRGVGGICWDGDLRFDTLDGLYARLQHPSMPKHPSDQDLKVSWEIATRLALLFAFNVCNPSEIGGR